MIELLELDPEGDDQITAVATTLRRHCTFAEVRQFREDLTTWHRQRSQSPSQPARTDARQDVEQWQRLLEDILREVEVRT